MRKTLAENISTPTSSLYWLRGYNAAGTVVIDNNGGYQMRNSGGTQSVIQRSPGPHPPDREKPFQRTFLSAITCNGDIAYYTRGVYGRDGINRLTGVFSSSTPGPIPSALVRPSNVPTPSSVVDFFNRYSVAVPPVSLDYRSQAEVKCLNKLRGEVSLSDLSFGVLWGERRETCELISSLLTGTWSVMRSCALRDYKASAKELKELFGVSATAAGEARRMRKVERRLKKELGKAPSLAQKAVAAGENAILAYNLGISPLVKDVKAAMASLTQLDPVTNSTIKVKSSYSRTVEDQVTWYADADPGDRTAQFFATAVETHGYTVTLTAAPRWDTWTLASRLGIADLNLAWELTRLSFLVDYYLAVGPWLSALNALHEFEWIDGSNTQRVIRNIRVSAKSTLFGGGSASGSGVVNHTQRRTYASMPFPFPPMSLRNRNLSSQDAQDAEAKRALNKAALASRSIRAAISGTFT